MTRERENTKQLWSNPQITEIKIKMTEGHPGHGQGHCDHGNGNGYGHDHCCCS